MRKKKAKKSWIQYAIFFLADEQSEVNLWTVECDDYYCKENLKDFKRIQKPYKAWMKKVRVTEI